MLTPSHAAALERAREKVAEAARLHRDGSECETPKGWTCRICAATDALLALESQTCESCGGTGIDGGVADYPKWPCRHCDHGRKRTEGE